MGRREDKKQETKFLIAQAAADLTIAHGSQFVTISEIARLAGVSQRTFHNYFPTRDDALHFFMLSAIQHYAELAANAPADLDLLDTVEYVMSEALKEDSEQIVNIPKLYALGQQFEIGGWAPSNAELKELRCLMIQSYLDRFPELDSDRVILLITVATQSLAAVLTLHFNSGPDRLIADNPAQCVTKVMHILRSGFQSLP